MKKLLSALISAAMIALPLASISTSAEAEPAKHANKAKKAGTKAKKAKKENAEPVDFEQFLLGTSFDGAYGRILVCAYAIDDEPVQALWSVDVEKKLLEDFWELARNIDLFVGHNIIDFDMRFLYQRSMILGVKPSRDLNFARYRDNPMYDPVS